MHMIYQFEITMQCSECDMELHVKVPPAKTVFGLVGKSGRKPGRLDEQISPLIFISLSFG